MSRPLHFAGIAVALFVALIALDRVQSDEAFAWGAFTVDLFEFALLAGAVAFTALTSVETREMRRERRELIADLDMARRESDRWRAAARVHVDGLSRAIRDQFDRWGFTETEAEVAILMLKGLTHKEIATLRNCAQATVRQHAAAVYRKSGLSSRVQFSAFFLEDLLAPATDRTGAPVSLVGRG